MLQQARTQIQTRYICQNFLLIEASSIHSFGVIILSETTITSSNMQYHTFVTVVLAILSTAIIIESKPVTPLQSNIEGRAQRRPSLEVINLGLRPATDIVLAKRSRVWRFVNSYPLRFTNSQVLGGPGSGNDHVECRSRHDGAPLVSITGNGQFDQARREFCNAFVGTVVPPGHELSAQVNGLINFAGAPSHLIGKYPTCKMII
jgi:hypothetical protein